MYGYIVSVDEARLGGQLITGVSASTLVYVEPTVDFAPSGGQARIGEDPVTYLSADHEAGTLTLSAPVSYPAGMPVVALPEQVEVTAYVQVDGPEALAPELETVPALVPYAMRGRLPLGVRPAGQGELARVEYSESFGRYVLADLPTSLPPEIEAPDPLPVDLSELTAAIESLRQRDVSVLASATGKPPTLTGSPTSGVIGWPPLALTGYGTSASVAGATTSHRYVWWTPPASTVATGNTLPGPDSVLLFINNNGSPSDVQNSEVIDGSLIVSGTVTASTLETYRQTPEGLQASGRLGASGADDYLEVFNASGDLVASIDANGLLVARGAALGSSVADVVLGGLPLSSLLDTPSMPAAGRRTTNGTASAVATTKIPWTELQLMLQPGRTYDVSLMPTYAASTVAGANVVLFMHQATGGATVAWTSPQIQSGRHNIPKAGVAYTVPPLVAEVRVPDGPVPVEYRFLVGYYGEGGGVNLVAGSGLPSLMRVEDKGPTVPDTVIDHGAPVVPVTKQTFTTYWRATQTASYRGDGSRRDDTTQMVHGPDPSGFNGNGCGVALFYNSGAYSSSNSGEVGKTPGQALAGATVNAASVAFGVDHTYSGAALIHYMPGNMSALPTTYTNPPTTYYDKRGFTPGEYRYVALPTTSGWTSVTFGQPPAAQTNYARLSGAGGPLARRPVLKMTYTR